MPNYDYIPDDIISDVLSRLPSKSLLRFKTVCKSWYSLISSPDFINLHSIRASRNPKFPCVTSSLFKLLDPETLSLDKSCFSAPFRFPLKTPFNNFLTILGSTCGLVCVESYHTVNSYDCYGRSCADARFCGSGLFLWNPFTREFRKIPDLKRYGIYRSGVAYTHGLGYDPVSNDVKLVVSKSGKTYSIFSMKSNSWKSIRCPPDLHTYPYNVYKRSEATVLNGVFHWLQISYSGSSFEIVAFDSTVNKFSNLQKPQVASSSFWNASLLEHKGCLCVSFSLSEPEKRFEIWTLKGHSWFQIITFSSKYISRFSLWPFSPICISRSGTRVILHSDNDILRSTKDDMFEGIHLSYISRATMCVETLISPNDIVYEAWKQTSGNREGEEHEQKKQKIKRKSSLDAIQVRKQARPRTRNSLTYGV